MKVLSSMERGGKVAWRVLIPAFQLSAACPNMPAEVLQVFQNRKHLFFNESAVHNKYPPMHTL